MSLKMCCGSYLYSSTYGTVASTYPNQSGCIPRSTSSQRKRTRLTECGDTGPPPAARSNSPWPHSGRKSPLPCSPPTKQKESSRLIALPVNVDTVNAILLQVKWRGKILSVDKATGRMFLVNDSEISTDDWLIRKQFCYTWRVTYWKQQWGDNYYHN